MSEFHAVVFKIDNISPHPDADRLDIINAMGGYPCIVAKGSFKIGDLAIYVPIDTVLPNTKDFEFLSEKDRKHLKAKKLRGVFSMGLIIQSKEGLQEDDDVTELLGIQRWEPIDPGFSNRFGGMIYNGDNEKEPTEWHFKKYTDIEGARKQKYANCFVEGEEVVLSEKVHGCVLSNTSITMFDGTKKYIKDIQENDYVLGVDNNNNIVPTKVLKLWHNDSSKRWLQLYISNTKANRGNSFNSLICTNNHEIAIKFDNQIIYKNAENLNVNDIVLIHRHDLSIPELQQQILLGMLLGDACADGPLGWSVHWGHSDKDVEYMTWIKRGLGDVFLIGSETEGVSGFGSKMHGARTIWSTHIKNLFQSFYIKNPVQNQHNKRIKIIPDWVADALTPISLAFWYMDDGNLGYGDGETQDNTVGFATCGFTIEDCKVLKRGLQRFNIEAKITNGDYPRMHLNAINAEKFFLLVAPYIPPCMQRKLPPRYRGGQGWLPHPGVPQRYTQLIEQKILSIKPINKKHKCYDLTTETHNYFANKTLIHNSNFRSTYVSKEDRLYIGSRQCNKRRPIDGTNSTWWQVAEKYDLENKLRTYAPDLIFFGEMYGQNQDLKYGCIKDTLDAYKLAFFDVYDVLKARYLDYDEATRILDALDLPKVPVLYRGPWKSLEEFLPLAELDSQIPGANHLSEGWVCRPVKERWDHRVGRLILKLHGQRFLLRK